MRGFFLHDPLEAVNSVIMKECGVEVTKASGARAVHELEAPSSESKSACSVAILPTKRIYLDVRDPSDAWVRVIVDAGEQAVVAPGTWWRIRTAAAPGSAEASSGSIVSPLAIEMACDAASSDDVAHGVLAEPADAGSAAAAGVVSVYAIDVASSASGAASGAGSASTGPVAVLQLRFGEGDNRSQELMERPYWRHHGSKHTRELVCELCNVFYELGWCSGTGGSISIKRGSRTYMAPSGVQKERMMP